MMRLRLFMFSCMMSSVLGAAVAPADFAYVLETFLNSSGQKWLPSVNDFKDLDFDKTGRLAIPFPFFDLSLVFDLGGWGAGSPFLPLPPAQRPYIDFSAEGLSPVADQAKIAMMKLIQNQFFGALGNSFGSSDPSVDFFSEDDASTQKKHLAEQIFNFKITPSMVYIIKLVLLMKKITEAGVSTGLSEGAWEGAKDAFSVTLTSLADFGILTFRLLNAWNRDSRVAGGLSAVIDEKSPEIGQLLRKMSKSSWGDELFIHRKLDSGWKLLMEGGGIVFGLDGSVKRGLGFSVSAIECASEADAAKLSEFLNQKQLNWDKIETQDMVGQSFLTRVSSLLQMYYQQITQLPEEVRRDREQHAEALSDILDNCTPIDLGRYDLDITNNTAIHPKLKSAAFRSLVGEGRALASYSTLPKVVSAGNSVYFCSNQTGPLDAAKLVAIIFFQALIRYISVLRGSNEMSSEMTAQIKEKERMLQSAHAYLAQPEASFLIVPLGMMLERPSVESYAIAGKYFAKNAARKQANEAVPAGDAANAEPKDTRAEAVAQLLQDAGKNYERAAARVGNIYKKAIKGLQGRLTTGVPELAELGVDGPNSAPATVPPAAAAAPAAGAPATATVDVAAAIAEGLKASENDIKSKMPPLPAEEGVGAGVGAGAGGPTGQGITTVEAMAEYMRNFKTSEIALIKANITTLEGLLKEAEDALRAVPANDNNLSQLAHWAKVQTALEGERKALIAVQAMPEVMRYPVQELKYGYDQAEKTLTALTKINRDNLATVLSDYRARAAKDPSARDKATRDALKKARNQLALYYECVLSLYADFLQALDGLWLLSGHALSKQCEENKVYLMQSAAGAGLLQPLANGSVHGALSLLSAQPSMHTFRESLDTERKDSESFGNKITTRRKAYENRQQIIWQGEGYSAVGRRELIEQRAAELQEALDDAAEVRKSKTATEDKIRSAAKRVSDARKALDVDQGRADLEELLRSSQDTLREVVKNIRAIDEETPTATEASRVGMQTLLKESFLFKHQKDLGSPFVNGLFSRIGKHLSLFKEMQPVRAEFEMRLRGISRMYPAFGASLPLLRVLANRFAPGIITEWV